MHEFVASARTLRREQKISAMDVCKRLLDFGFHAPTVYFPLVVPEALMMEPTETESKETLDAFADALLKIKGEDAGVAADGPAHARRQPAGRGEGGQGAGPAVDPPTAGRLAERKRRGNPPADEDAWRTSSASCYTPRAVERRPADHYARVPVDAGRRSSSTRASTATRRAAGRASRQLNVMPPRRWPSSRAEGFKAGAGRDGRADRRRGAR